MTILGIGRGLTNLTPRISGVGRSFTMGFGVDYTTAPAEINGAYQPLLVTQGEPVGNEMSAVDDELPRGVTLGQNYPNPFNPATTIRFQLPTHSAVDLSVYDMAGRRVRTLVRENLAAGAHAVIWDGQDQGGRLAASGIYLYRLVTPEQVLHGKMTLLE